MLFHDIIIIPVVFRAWRMPEINCTLNGGVLLLYKPSFNLHLISGDNIFV
ncbi:hypothetical protein BN132_1496 [Cronobacter turicensis 564]|nr:hypothetical protein BN132_1496 [Cronobacter turicensis 564]